MRAWLRSSANHPRDSADEADQLRQDQAGAQHIDDDTGEKTKTMPALRDTQGTDGTRNEVHDKLLSGLCNTLLLKRIWAMARGGASKSSLSQQYLTAIKNRHSDSRNNILLLRIILMYDENRSHHNESSRGATMKPLPLSHAAHMGLNKAQAKLASCAAGKQTLDSGVLFAGSSEVVIAHGEEIYRLRLTRQNRLILTK